MTKRVLVTGGAGFIGHRLIREILENPTWLDWEVVSLDRLDTSGCLDRLAWVMDTLTSEQRERLHIVFHDMKAEFNSFLKKKIGHIDIILHLGAGSHVDRSIEDPMSFVMDNVVGTANVLNFAKEIDDLDLFLYFSTDEVFGPAPEGVFYKEWDRYNSGNPYSATKAGAEELCLAYSNTYGIPMAISHTMNVIGNRQHPEKYVPLCIGKVLSGEKVYIHANPECTDAGTRHYIDVADVADAVCFLLDKHQEGQLKFCDKYNVVGSQEIDNEALYLMIKEIVEGQLQRTIEPNYELVDFHSARKGHDLRYALCGEKMAKLGWKPRPLQMRLEKIVQWYLSPENCEQWLDIGHSIIQRLEETHKQLREQK